MLEKSIFFTKGVYKRTSNRLRWAGVSAPRLFREFGLGNSAKSLRNFGRRRANFLRYRKGLVACNGGERLFNKNTGSC